MPKVMLGATSLFISGIIVFYVIYYGITLWNRIEASILNKNETIAPDTQRIMSLLRVVPTILTIMYILVVVAVIYYLIYSSSKEKKKILASPYEETVYGPSMTTPYTNPSSSTTTASTGYA